MTAYALFEGEGDLSLAQARVLTSSLPCLVMTQEGANEQELLLSVSDPDHGWNWEALSHNQDSPPSLPDAHLPNQQAVPRAIKIAVKGVWQLVDPAKEKLAMDDKREEKSGRKKQGSRQSSAGVRKTTSRATTAGSRSGMPQNGDSPSAAKNEDQNAVKVESDPSNGRTTVVVLLLHGRTVDVTLYPAAAS